MNAAVTKEPAGSAGSRQKLLYSKSNISQNQHVVNSAIAKTRARLHLDRIQWQNFAIFCTRFALDSAPEDVRALFIGKPSETPKDALLLAEICAVLVVRAEDMATATGTSYAYIDIWQKAIEIWEACK
jgi:hypothetical protein